MALTNVQELEYYLSSYLNKPDALAVLAEKTEARLGFPLYYMDTNWNALVFSPSVKKDGLIERMKNRSTSDFQTYCSEITKKIDKGGPVPVLVNGPLIGRQQMIVKSYYNGVSIGHITFLAGKQKLTQADPECLMAAARVFGLAHRLGRTDQSEYFDCPWNRFLHEILSGQFTNRNQFDQRMQSTSTLYPVSRCGILKIESRGGSLSPVAYQELYYYAGRERCCLASCHYDNSMVILMDLTENEPDFLQQEEFLKLLQKYALYVGYDYPGDDLYKLYSLYVNADSAVRYAKRWNSVHPIQSYDAAKLYDMFTTIQPPSGSLTQYVARSVTQMREYDQEFKTSYYETMRCYIRNRMRNTQTADELHIHKTTLNYRLEKMREQFGIEWEGNSTLIHLYVSVFILENMAL